MGKMSMVRRYGLENLGPGAWGNGYILARRAGKPWRQMGWRWRVYYRWTGVFLFPTRTLREAAESKAAKPPEKRKRGS